MTPNQDICEKVTSIYIYIILNQFLYLVIKVLPDMLFLLWTKLQQSGYGSNQLKGFIFPTAYKFNHHMLQILEIHIRCCHGGLKWRW